MRMRRPMRWKTGSPSSSSRSRIWRLIADCETCSFSPAAVNEPVSAIARMISSCRRSMASVYSERGARPFDRVLQIPLVHLDADEADPELRAGHRGRPQSQKWIRNDLQPLESVQAEAHLREPWRKRGGVGPILLAALNCFVRDEPGVAAASDAGRRRPPAADVGLVLIFHADRLPLDRRGTRRAEVEDELVAVVQKPPAVNRLVVADSQIVRQSRT